MHTFLLISNHAHPNPNLSGFLVAATSVISKETATNEGLRCFFVVLFFLIVFLQLDFD